MRSIEARKSGRRGGVSAVLAVILVEVVALAGQGVDAALVIDHQTRFVEDHDIVLEWHPFGVSVLEFRFDIL